MKRSYVDELVVDLYLRLNGYLTTGLIVHSHQWGQTQTEIDKLAVRNKFHSQHEREIGCSDFLSPQYGKSDLIICEVKSDCNSLRFNDALLRNSDPSKAILSWVGLTKPEEIESLSESLLNLLDRTNRRDASARNGIKSNDIVIRALLCCPSVEEFGNDWILGGKELFGYIDKCLNPTEKREACSTRYNFQQWGYPFTDIVKYFKDKPHEHHAALGLYKHMGCKP